MTRSQHTVTAHGHNTQLAQPAHSHSTRSQHIGHNTLSNGTQRGQLGESRVSQGWVTWERSADPIPAPTANPRNWSWPSISLVSPQSTGTPRSRHGHCKGMPRTQPRRCTQHEHSANTTRHTTDASTDASNVVTRSLWGHSAATDTTRPQQQQQKGITGSNNADKPRTPHRDGQSGAHASLAVRPVV